MGTGTDAARETRQAELRARYATWLRADVDALKRERAASFRRLIPGCTAGIAVLVAVGAALFAPGWPDRWWADPLSLARIAVVIGGTWWFARTFFVLTPDAEDAKMAGQDLRFDALVQRWAAQVRPGASYEPWGCLEPKWAQVAHLVEGNRPSARGIFSWDLGDTTVRAAAASVIHYGSKRDGQVDTDGPCEIRFQGWMATASLPQVVEAAVRVRAQGSAKADICDDERLRPLHLPALAPAYSVRATDPAVAGRVLAPAIAQLMSEAGRGRLIHLGVAGRSVVVLLEGADGWSGSLHAKFDEERALLLGDTLDVLHSLVDAVITGATAKPNA